MIQLRPYQKSVVREVSQHYQAGVKSVLLQKPTGSGKTRTAAFIVEKYTSTGRQVLWVVHREELLLQAAMVYAEQGIPHRLICAASTERAVKVAEFKEFGKSFVDPTAVLIIASVQTIVRRLDKLPWLDPVQIVADESHLSLAKTWLDVIGHWPNARLLGLTATPCRLDNKPFARSQGGIYDEIVIGPRIADLIEMGNLAQYKVYAPPVHLKEGVKIGIKGGDFDTHDLEEELDSPFVYGDVLSHYKKLSHGKPAIAFCPTVASAKKFADYFVDGGYRAIALDGETDDMLRRDSLKKLAAGEIDVIFSVAILIEGTDIPYATTAIWLRRSKSLSMYLQGTGRVLRPHPMKEHAIIIDCVGIVAIHGLPCEDREWSLYNEEKSTKRKKPDDEEDVKVMTCGKCFSMFKPAPVCPACGEPHAVREKKETRVIDGELVEISPEAMDAMRRERRVLQGKAQTVGDLVAQGMSRGRAEKIVQARADKQAIVEQILVGIETHRAATGEGAYAWLGVTVGDIRKMKPKELKNLLAKM